MMTKTDEETSRRTYNIHEARTNVRGNLKRNEVHEITDDIKHFENFEILMRRRGITCERHCFSGP
jgi:hypothetical protein